MCDGEDLARQAERLGYGLQICVSAGTAGGTVELPAGFGHLWILCSVGDRVQRRWMDDRSALALVSENDGTPSSRNGPLDDFCLRELTGLLHRREHRFLYPLPSSEDTPPVLALLEQLGLYRPSPIMSSLHEQFGSWWAVRAILAVKEPIRTPAHGELVSDPCIGCAAPCIDACPADAVSREGWQWQPCAEERSSDASSCADRCFSRLVCPSGVPYRYSEPVLRYHYLASLATIRHALANPRKAVAQPLLRPDSKVN